MTSSRIRFSLRWTTWWGPRDRPLQARLLPRGKVYGGKWHWFYFVQTNIYIRTTYFCVHTEQISHLWPWTGTRFRSCCRLGSGQVRESMFVSSAVFFNLWSGERPRLSRSRRASPGCGLCTRRRSPGRCACQSLISFLKFMLPWERTPTCKQL